LSAATFGAYSIRAIAGRLQVPGSKLLIQIAFVVLVVLPSALFGHFEDVFAIAFILLALRSLANARYEVAALLFSLALGFKHWAFLAVPVFIAVVPRGARLRCLALASALPLSLAGFTLLVDWEHASEALLSSPTFPSLGHSVPWVDPRADEIGTLVYRVITLAVAGMVAWRLWRGASREVVLAGLALVLLARPIVEPVPHMYYLAPGLAFLLLLERFTTGRLIRTLLVGLPLLTWFLFTPGQVVWWAVFATGLIALTLPSIRLMVPARPKNADRPLVLVDPVSRASYERNDHSSAVVLTARTANSASLWNVGRAADRDLGDTAGASSFQGRSPRGRDRRGRAGDR
jgi:hypothetical protein